MKTDIRPFTAKDIGRIVDYFLNAEVPFLQGMGVEKGKLPPRAAWIAHLQRELALPLTEKNYYYVIWQLDGQAIGHSNVNNIRFGASATMHLHLWERERRNSGLGLALLKQTIPWYFNTFELEKLVCEPFAYNEAPNKTLQKLGFTLLRTYETTPGPINFHQLVNRYELNREQLEQLNG